MFETVGSCRSFLSLRIILVTVFLMLVQITVLFLVDVFTKHSATVRRCFFFKLFVVSIIALTVFTPYVRLDLPMLLSRKTSKTPPLSSSVLRGKDTSISGVSRVRLFIYSPRRRVLRVHFFKQFGQT